MEVVLQAPKTFSGNVKKKRVLLSQLVEETRTTASVSHHLLETSMTRSVHNKVKVNNVVEAEPSELHFSGFEVGKVYKKSVKLINISSEVLSVHILPTQTKYFSTEYTKKNRLVPGLSYTINVHFSPDEWRYFFDSIRVHCKGEANLLVPVHAYPVMDNLHIPSHIRLPAVPLGHSTSHVIPLSCKCPIDFEFQVYCLKPHEAFTVHPLSGIIPANGKTHFTVTFTPHQYGTADITLQLVISQFNSRPIICTLSASCSPYLTLNQQDSNVSDQMFADITKTEVPPILPATPKHKSTPTIMKHSKKKVQAESQPQDSAVDVSTPAGLVKMLIQHPGKINYKDLRESMSINKDAHQTRQMREAAFEDHVLANVQKERANHLQWQVHLGESVWSTEQKMNVLREQEFAAAENMMKNDPGGGEVDFTRVFSTLSSQRVLRNVGQVPDGSPVFHVYDSSSLEIRQRLLRVFQQAARKVILRCRMNNRLLSLRDLASKLKRHDREHEDTADTRPQLAKISSEKLQPFQMPVFTQVDRLDDLAVNGLGCVPVRQIKLDLTPNIPLFNLKVPQHFRLKGYRELSPYEAGASFVRTELARTLRTGAQDELLPAGTCPAVPGEDEEPREERDVERDLRSSLCFSAPTDMLRPPKAHPLRIFNPAPGVHVFKPTPLYLESDVDFHLCPLPRYAVSQGSVVGVYTPITQKKFLDRKDVIKGIMTWKKFPSLAMTTFPSTSTRTNNWVPRLSDPFNISLLPLQAPPGLQDLPDSMREDITSDTVEGSENSLTPEMVQAEFPPPENGSSKPLKDDSTKDDREKRKLLLQSTLKSQTNKLGPKVLARMKYLKSLEESILSAHDCK
ncbi:cilia- and flagella-associated protein 221 isoform X2 [Brachyhypopomus gauderio]|uniref:cilia- and flagella-associated protein 221 isoform X2 n=1 Tax=Brachyhypopomus gauderio TaxID=698409 RepID=UPI004041FE44